MISISPHVIDAFLTGCTWTMYELAAFYLGRKIFGKPREVS